MTSTIALVEDDPLQLEPLKAALEEAGFKVQAYTTRQDAEKALLTDPSVDLLVSDIILAGERDGGFDLAKHLQQNGFKAPIIFLSERQDEYDIMLGHELGAVDYLPKPFNINILIAKVNNLLKITKSHRADDALEIEGLDIDAENYKVRWKGEPIHLTATEFEMLYRFAQAGENKVVTYDQLKEATQGVVERNTINTHICRIRNAFRKVDPQFNMIHNEYGRGYSWRHKEAKADRS